MGDSEFGAHTDALGGDRQGGPEGRGPLGEEGRHASVKNPEGLVDPFGDVDFEDDPRRGELHLSHSEHAVHVVAVGKGPLRHDLRV